MVSTSADPFSQDHINLPLNVGLFTGFINMFWKNDH